MDPAEFGISTLPLQHSPYPAISSETLSKANVGKVAVVTGAAGGTLFSLFHFFFVTLHLKPSSSLH
jgi:cadmium resistance protein CadD (predicted permease)